MPPRKRPTRRRRRDTREFATMKCPVKGCTHWLATEPGTVPGVKRHVLAIHGQRAYNRIQWPPSFERPRGKRVAAALRAGRSLTEADLWEHSVVELRGIARQRGIPITGKNKEELVSALS